MTLAHRAFAAHLARTLTGEVNSDAVQELLEAKGVDYDHTDIAEIERLVETMPREYADRIPLTRPCHTTEQHHRIANLEADLRTARRGEQEALDENTAAWAAINRAVTSGPGSLADHIDQLAAERNERLTLVESSRLAKRLDAAEQLAEFRAGVIALRASELALAGRTIAAQAEQLQANGTLLARLRDLDEQADRIAAWRDRAWAEHDTAADYRVLAEDPGSPADRAQDRPDIADRLAGRLADALGRLEEAASGIWVGRFPGTDVDRWRELLAEHAQGEPADLRERLTALAALEEYIGESCRNASHNLRDVLAGADPRPDADRHVPDWRTPTQGTDPADTLAQIRRDAAQLQDAVTAGRVTDHMGSAYPDGSAHDEPASPSDGPGEPCASCGCPRKYHDERITGCAGDFLCCPCRGFVPAADARP